MNVEVENKNHKKNKTHSKRSLFPPLPPHQGDNAVVDPVTPEDHPRSLHAPLAKERTIAENQLKRHLRHVSLSPTESDDVALERVERRHGKKEDSHTQTVTKRGRRNVTQALHASKREREKETLFNERK